MMPNRTQAPQIYSPIEFDFPLQPCNTMSLDNGIPLHYVTDSIEPVMQLEMVFQAGSWYEPKSGVAQATAALLKSGTGQRTSFEINETFEQYGATFRASAGPDWASVTLSCLTKHLGKVLPIVAELLVDTCFPASELEIYIQNAKQRLSVQLLKSDFVANRHIDEYLFGFQHPYGKYLWKEDYDALTSADLLDYLKNYFTAGNCRMFLAGYFQEADLDLINQTLGHTDWNAGGKRLEPKVEVIPALEKKYRISNDANGVQGSIRMASAFPDKHHPDFVPMIVLNTLFGGYFGSRLMSNIREEKGYTYGIHSFMYNHKMTSAYMITTEAGKDVCEAAITEIYHEMQVLRDELVSDDELELVKNYLLGTILGDLDGSFQIIQRWKNLILNGFSEERFHSNIQTYKNISATQLQQLANTYYQPDRFYELVVI